MIRFLFSLLLTLGSWTGSQASPGAAHPAFVSFTSSNLPIIVINTEGRQIVNEPKIAARMGIIDNGPGRRNHVTDSFNGYDGWIGIETRGSSSQMFPKKSYAVETRTLAGVSRDVSLLGMPADNDWILYAPYTDKSLLRNELIFWLANRMGHYASRTRFCEVVVNGDYQGIYLLMEKIKRGKNRVDISKLEPTELTGDDLTGGYIIKVDKTDGAEVDGWRSPFPPPAAPDRRILYQYHYPDPGKIKPEQKLYIRGVIDRFEQVMAKPDFTHPETGYGKYIDVPSFVDFFLLNEVSKNVDGYRLSSFMYKDRDSKGGKLYMGPMWDFNLAFGNADYYAGSVPTNFQAHFAVPTDHFQIPFWWPRLLTDTSFVRTAGHRWRALRQTVLHTDTLYRHIDEQVALLAEAHVRNFERWPVLGRYVWPNAFVGRTYQEEIKYLKDWILQRVTWLDNNLPATLLPRDEDPSGPYLDNQLSVAFPNPFTHRADFSLRISQTQHVRVLLIDLLGREVAVLHEGVLDAYEPYRFTIEAGNLPNGVYLYRAYGRHFDDVRPIVLAR